MSASFSDQELAENLRSHGFAYGAEAIERLTAERDKLASHAALCRRMVCEGTKAVRDEAKALEPGNDALSCMAIDLWNRLESGRVAAEKVGHFGALFRGVPQTFVEAVGLYGEHTVNCEPHEWDNRTTAENAVWLIERLIAERDEARRLISEEPRTKTSLPPWFQRLWEACLTLAEKAEFKAALRHLGQVEDHLGEAIRERDAVVRLCYSRAGSPGEEFYRLNVDLPVEHEIDYGTEEEVREAILKSVGAVKCIGGGS